MCGDAAAGGLVSDRVKLKYLVNVRKNVLVQKSQAVSNKKKSYIIGTDNTCMDICDLKTESAQGTIQ